MIDGFRITILTGIFPNLGACFSRIVLVFSTFSCCWSSRGTFIRVRIHQARNRRFHGKIFDIAQGSAFLAWKVGRNSNFQVFRGIRIVGRSVTFLFWTVKPQRNKDILPKKLKPECGASSQRCNANKGNRETIVFCLLLVSNLSLQIPRVTFSCHNTMDCNRTPTLRGTENTPDLDMASRDHSGSITY